MKDFKKLPKMACGGGVKKYGVGGAIKEAAKFLIPAAGVSAAVAPAAHKDLTSGYTAKMREANEEKTKTEKKEPENKKRGGSVNKRK
jgi:ribosomal protein L12E/L44/L45/RPP1/RPP2